MGDWKTQCEVFSRDHQPNGLKFPDSCGSTGAKSISQIMNLSKRVNDLNGKIKTIGNNYNANDTSDDALELRNAMKEFCCAMSARIEYEQKYKEATQDYEVAKQRVESVRNPAAQVSYFGTAFPFGRPLRPDSVPILLSFIFFFIIMSLGLLLSLGNVQIAYMAPQSYGPSYFQQLVDAYRQTTWAVLLITVVASMGIATGIWFGVKRAKPEWFA
jgi:hypothetical protein